MKETIILLLLWYVFVALHYFVAKRITSGLDELHFKKVVTAPYIFWSRRLRKLHNDEKVALIAALFIFVGLITIWNRILLLLKNLLFANDEWLYFPTDVHLVSAVILSIASTVLFLLFISRRKLPLDPLWNIQPTQKEALILSSRLKRRGFILAIIFQFFFVMGINDGTIVRENMVYVREMSFLPDRYTYKDIDYLFVRLKSTDDSVVPVFEIRFKNKKRANLIYGDGTLLEEDLNKLKLVAQFMHSQNVELLVSSLSIMDKQALKAKYIEMYQSRIEQLFYYCESLVEEIAEPYSSGDSIAYEEAIYTLDSVKVADTRKWLGNDEDYYLDVYMTIQNKDLKDTLHFSTMLNLHIAGIREKKYKTSYLSSPDDEIETDIPPKDARSGALRFLLSEDIDQLTLMYRTSIFEEKYLKWRLSDLMMNDE